MRALRFIAVNFRFGVPLVLLALLAVFLLRFAQHVEDADVEACHARGGEVVIDEYPHQADLHRCMKDGKAIAAWKRIDGRNVLILDWSVDW